MAFNNPLAAIRNKFGAAGFFILFGITLVVVGIILFNFKTDHYLETAGTITAVQELPVDMTDEDRQPSYDVDVVYTVDGKEYNGTFSGLTGVYTANSEITVYYDPQNPESIANAKMGDTVPIIMIVVGGVALLYGVFRAIRAFAS